MIPTVDGSRHALAGVLFDFLPYESIVARVDGWISRSERRHIVVANPHSVVLAHRKRQMADAIAAADLVLPDGIGVVLAARLTGMQHYGRLPGPSLMLRLIERGISRGWSHYFFGGAPGTPERLVARLSQRYPGLRCAGYASPPFCQLSETDDRQFLDAINNSRAHVLWVGLGAPKQEEWIFRNRSVLLPPVAVGVGAAFDFHAGNVRWAPQWVRLLGFEWAWRLALSPRAMWRRNLSSPLFLWWALRSRQDATYARYSRHDDRTPPA